MSILDEVHSLRTEIEKDWAHIDSIESLENFRVKFFGKKGKVQDIIKKNIVTFTRRET